MNAATRKEQRIIQDFHGSGHATGGSYISKLETPYLLRCLVGSYPSGSSCFGWGSSLTDCNTGLSMDDCGLP